MGRTLTAGAFATTASLALSLFVTPGAPAIAEPSAAPREVTVVPQNAPTVLPVERLWFAGKTGFLHHHNSSTQYLWTRYDTGETVVVKDLTGVSPYALRSAGGDSVSIWAPVPAHPTDGTVNVLDLSNLSWEQWKQPTDGTLYGIYGRDMLVRLGEQLELQTVDADGTIVRTRPVTGLPDGERALHDEPVTSDGESSVVVEVGTMEGYWYGVIDVATAQAVRIPDIDLSTLGDFKVSGDTVAWISNDATVHAYSRKGLLDGTNTTARTAKVGDNRSRLAIVGDRVLGVIDKRDGKRQGPAAMAPLGGGSQSTVLPLAELTPNSIIQGPNGTALLVGGTDYKDWSVRRFSPTGGEPTEVPVLPVRDPVGTAALTYRHGVLRHLQSEVYPFTNKAQYPVFHHNLAPDDGSGSAGGAIYASGRTLASNTAACAPQVSCVRMLDNGYNGVAYVALGVNGETSLFTQNESRYATALPTTNGRLVDADDRYAIVDGGSPATQYVVDTGSRTVVRTSPIVGAGLWYSTLWTATTTAGQLKQLSLPGGTTLRTISTGVACAPTEVQVSTRWLYWSCGTTGPAGAYDLTLNRNVRLPSGPTTLGDGFVVRHDAATASLRMTDFHDGTVRSEVKLADLPVGTPADSRGISWTVDRLGAGVAYADGENAVHVLDTGVPSTPPTLGKATIDGTANPRTLSPWTAYLRFTRPVSSWQATITHKPTGRTFTVGSGGPVRDGVNVAWNGWLPQAGMAANGGYRWTVTANVDGGPSVTLGSGSLVSTCGVFPFRTWDCYGGQALLGVKPNGDGLWYGEAPNAEPTGHLYNQGSNDYWCLSCTGAARTSALVPFGDIDGDGRPDLLVRDGLGGMRAYLGNGRNDFAPGTKYISLGKGWMMYRALLAPGDLNRDGHDDLLGVDSYGKLWLYALPGNGGIKPRVQVGSGWGIYPRVIGAGDLNGDGNGDLLGIDSTGVMYRYFGSGNGGFGARVKVFSGWNIYNAIVPIGDLNQDGRHDLVARDVNGVLWFYAGLGNGSFAPRVQKGSGWSIFKIIV